MWYYHPSVLLYFSVLFYAGRKCILGCSNRALRLLSLGFCLLTWFFILRWTLEYKGKGGDNLFDDAYLDVLQAPHAAISSQFLLWVVVAAGWVSDLGWEVMGFGCLGAMSASFITQVDIINGRGGRISVSYFFSSFLGLLAVFKLLTDDVRGDESSFRFWLLVLHGILFLPRFLPGSPTVPKFYFFFVLLVTLIFCRKLSLFSGDFVMPVSDCQKSISIDFVLCTIINWLYVYRNPSLRPIIAIFAVFVAIVGLTPAETLSLQLAVEYVMNSYRDLITKCQWYVSSRKKMRDSRTSVEDDEGWMNLGLAEGDYTASCASLSDCLASAAGFASGDRVLSVGCGRGAELIRWKESCDLQHITGLDAYPEGKKKFPLLSQVRYVQDTADTIIPRFKGKIRFNKIVSLDAIYHFENKVKFIHDSYTLLTDGNNNEGGVFCVTDLVLARGKLPSWVRTLLLVMNVRAQCVWSEEEYEEKLLHAGFEDVKITSLKTDADSVLDKWFPKAITRHLDYVVISAKATGKKQSTRLPKVAVIGSGMSGLTAAHKLVGTHDVTIFEANEKVGLSGQGVEIFGQVVDVPLRIIGAGYYRFLDDLARSLEVELKPIRKDYLTQQNYGDNGPMEGETSFRYSNKNWENILSWVPHVGDLVHFGKTVYKSDVDGDGKTWGEWLKRSGYSIGSKFDSMIIWMLMGQASWMLSCTYEQVYAYPASIILNFIRGFGWGGDLYDTLFNSSSKCTMMRIHPSLQSLEFALSYGSKIKTGSRVKGVDKNLMVMGEKFDYVIIATEAAAIKHILAPKIAMRSSVFDRIQYQPSTIYLHTDDKVMPTLRKNWMAFNVHQKSGEDCCQLTVWLNEYYPDANFPSDVFQTWNAFTEPCGVIKKCDFLRVVHTGETEGILQGIEDLQGQDSIYYAGAYSVAGAGLLEQAALSGEKVINMIKMRKR